MTLGVLGAAPVAGAATLRVDDDRGQCPAAQYTSIQAAVNAAAPGDTVTICPGSYAEGPGTPGSNALTIAKSLTIKGAGADLVTLKPQAEAQISEAEQDIRNGTGDIISVVGDKAMPIKVDISGITVDGNKAVVEAGVVYLDATGSFYRSRIKNVVTSELAADFNKPGGFRGPQFGYGIAHVTANTVAPPGATTRLLTVSQSRIEQYNRVGVLVDSSTNDAPPYVRSGVRNHAVISNNSIVGRLLCTNFGPTGNCTASGSPGNQLITTETLFGQDGVRIAAGASSVLTGNTISQNLVNGNGAPTRGQPANNVNLWLGAGIRLVDAQASSATRNNIADNAYGVHNTEANGETANETVPFSAENNWWGLRPGAGGTLPNAGPAVTPTTNPPFPENPVNGLAITDEEGATSTAVDYSPHRNGAQGDGQNGEFTVFDSPLPMDDAGPNASLSTDKSVALLKDTVELTALAGDDFGVKAVTFYDGAQVLATDTLPPYTATLTIAEDAICAERTLAAVVEDSLGQTASSSLPLLVDCTATAEPEPEPTPTPTATPTAPPTSTPPTTVPPSPQGGQVSGASTTGVVLPEFGPSGTIINVNPNLPGGVAAADFFLGTRKVCSRSAAPFSCRIRPTGAEVGAQTLRVVVTDRAGKVSESSRTVLIERFRLRKLVLGASKLRTTSTTKGWRIAGRLALPMGVSASQGCRSGRVTLVLKRSGATLANEQVAVTRGCTFSKTIRVPRRGTYELTGQFGGNAVLRPAKANRRLS